MFQKIRAYHPPKDEAFHKGDSFQFLRHLTCGDVPADELSTIPIRVRQFAPSFKQHLHKISSETLPQSTSSSGEK